MTEEGGQWPSAADYVSAAQDPEQCLVDERIRHAEFKLNMMGIPSVQSGQVAAVFPATVDGEEPCHQISTGLLQGQFGRPLPTHFQVPDEFDQPISTVEATWIPEAVAFGTGVYPAVVVLPWVSGSTLSTFIDDSLEDGDPHASAI